MNKIAENTKNIQEAVDKCFKAGGGKVVIPKGVHFSGPLRLRSNVTLYLEEGAILKASPNIDDYYPIGFNHNEWGDVKIKDSPCWTFSINSSENIRIHNIIIENNLRVPNSDGLHFCSCKNVIISNLLIKNSNRGIGIFANGKSGVVKNVLINNVSISTKIFAGTWWGKGEPIVMLAHCEGNLIEDVNIENVSAYSENGILIYGCDNNIRKVNFRNINIRLGYSKNRNLFGKYLDLAPSPKIYLPDYEKKIPWIIAKNVRSLGLFGVSYGYNDDFNERDFSIDEIFENINGGVFREC